MLMLRPTLVVLAAVLLLLPSRVAASGCGVCAETGECSAAFRGGPGMYCGAFYAVQGSGAQPCCCPDGAVCKLSYDQCLCHMSSKASKSSHNNDYVPKQQDPRQHDDGPRKTASPSVVVISLCVLAAAVLACCLCGWAQEAQGSRIPVATAMPAYGSTKGFATVPYPPGGGGGYGQGGGGYGHGGGYSAENPNYYNSGGTGGGVGSNIMSGLAGLAVGGVVGDLIGRSGGGQDGGGQDGGGQDGGGYDAVGDSGGDGGGGYDIAGDDGGGYDFAGDDGGDE